MTKAQVMAFKGKDDNEYVSAAEICAGMTVGPHVLWCDVDRWFKFYNRGTGRSHFKNDPDLPQYSVKSIRQFLLLNPKDLADEEHDWVEKRAVEGRESTHHETEWHSKTGVVFTSSSRKLFAARAEEKETIKYGPEACAKWDNGRSIVASHTGFGLKALQKLNPNGFDTTKITDEERG
jgi:hypothetical protein